MASFFIFAKAESHANFQQVCEINQVVTNNATDSVRDRLAALIADRWQEINGAGIVEFRNAQDAVLIRVTTPNP